jgi:hypothetical protein
MVPVVSALVAVLLAACDAVPDHLRQDIQERRLEEAGVADLDPSGTSSSAGISILRGLEVRPMDPRTVGADTTSQGFHRYVHRCGTCHAAPDPTLKTSSEWRLLFPRMEKHMREVGLIPLGPLDQRLILEFLQRHGGTP